MRVVRQKLVEGMADILDEFEARTERSQGSGSRLEGEVQRERCAFTETGTGDQCAGDQSAGARSGDLLCDQVRRVDLTAAGDSDVVDSEKAASGKRKIRNGRIRI